jgi:endonuclease/exonuclease/phosphatase family metal-dependent hydrolase
MRAPRFLSLAVVVALAACNGDDDDDGPSRVTVMTRNLYLGAELDAIITAETQEAFLAGTTGVWLQARANDFGARAAELAQEIADTQPDLVGLQEVSLWRTQAPSDFLEGNPVAATTVAIDHLEILLDELRQRGLVYDAVATVELFDQEVPALDDPTNPASLVDVRLTDRQVILARQGVAVSNPREEVFPDEVLLPLDLLGNPFRVKRGWTAVDAQIGGETFTFFNTHLESFLPAPRVAQAAALAAVVDSQAGRVLLVGDLNSLPDTEGHAAMTAIGLDDAWEAVGSGAGPTCCFDGDLSAPRETRDLETRIDYVMWRGALAPEAVQIVGDEDADRTQSGLWPSDHAGVVATFRFE